MEEDYLLPETWEDSGFDPFLDRGIAPFEGGSSGLVTATEFEAKSEAAITSIGSLGGVQTLIKIFGGQVLGNDGSFDRWLVGNV